MNMRLQKIKIATDDSKNDVGEVLGIVVVNDQGKVFNLFIWDGVAHLCGTDFHAICLLSPYPKCDTLLSMFMRDVRQAMWAADCKDQIMQFIGGYLPIDKYEAGYNEVAKAYDLVIVMIMAYRTSLDNLAHYQILMNCLPEGTLAVFGLHENYGTLPTGKKFPTSVTLGCGDMDEDMEESMINNGATIIHPWKAVSKVHLDTFEDKKTKILIPSDVL